MDGRWERRRIARLHSHRPLYDLYTTCAPHSSVGRAGAGSGARGAGRGATIPTDLDADSVGLGQAVQDVLVGLEAHLPADMAAYFAVVDEHHAVPLVDGTRNASGAGLDIARPRLFSPEAHALLNRHAGLVVPDLRADQRFAPAAPAPAPTGADGCSGGATSLRNAAAGTDDGGPELGDARFFAAQPVLCPAGDAVAVVCVRSAVPLGGVRPGGGLQTWTSADAAALARAAVDTAAVLEHVYRSRIQQDKKRMVERTSRKSCALIMYHHAITPMPRWPCRHEREVRRDVAAVWRGRWR